MRVTRGYQKMGRRAAIVLAVVLGVLVGSLRPGSDLSLVAAVRAASGAPAPAPVPRSSSPPPAGALLSARAPAGTTSTRAGAVTPSGEVPSLRTRTSRTYLVAGGYEAVLYAGSVNYQDAS
ncbi:MAG: hypothetical protein ACREPI_12910, partial [Candidatus Dormibacterales bacterium]